MKNRVLIVAFLNHYPPDFEFSKWPNHITIVPYFYTAGLADLIGEITKICTETEKVPYEVGSIDYFGSRKLKVSKIKKPAALQNFHESLADVAVMHDKGMDIRFCYARFVPHITHNEVPYPEENDENIIKEVSIVQDISASTKAKKIVANIKLGNTQVL